MHRDNFCRDWRFSKTDIPGIQDIAFDDQAWKSVTLPHTWNANDMGPGLPLDQSYIGPAWYRKRFHCPQPSTDERVFLLFESAANFSEVWVDGCFVGGRDGGFLSFRLDITQALQLHGSEDHLVAVRVDSSPRTGSMPTKGTDWDRCGGLTRPAWLCRTAGAHFEHKGIRVRTPEVSPERATVTLTARIWEKVRRTRAVTLRHRIVDPDGREVAAIERPVTTHRARTVEDEVTLTVEQPQLWSPATPQLYTVECTLLEDERVLDSATEPLGFRWVTFDADTGFALNGEPLRLQGVCVHEQFPGMGSALPLRFFREEFEQMRGCGINYIRTSHYPRNERVLDLCDELGIMVMEEQPYWHGSMRVYHGEALVTNARRLLRDMIQHHGNHPCIVAWNTVNEIMLANVKDGELHPSPSQRTEAHRLPREEWPFAVRCISEMNDELHQETPQRLTSAILGAGWAQNLEADIDGLCDVIGLNGGAFNNLVDGQPLYDFLRDRDPAARMVMTEGVINDNDAMHHRADWDKELAAWKIYAMHWSRIYERPWLPGGSMWVYEDYSAQGRHRPMGIVDIALLPHEGWHFFRSLWTDDLMVHICGHWSWPGQEGEDRELAVFTNGDEVELWLNGASLGTGTPARDRWPALPHPPVLFTVPYQLGELVAVARRAGDEVRDVRQTEGAPAQVVLTASSPTLHVDGEDAAFVTATIVDTAGNRCYRFDGTLTAAAAGPGAVASWGGTGEIEMRGGLGRFAVRSTGEPGMIAIRCEVEGLVAGMIEVDAQDQ